MGARAVDDTLPERGLRADADEKRYGACEHVALAPVVAVEAAAAGETVGAGDGCYFPVCVLLALTI